MATDRTKMQSYFDEPEEKAIQAYAEENELTISKAIEALVIKGLEAKEESPRQLVLDMFYDQRLDVLTERVDKASEVFQCHVEKTEKLEYQICCLEDALSSLRSKLDRQVVREYSDDEVSAMTGQRVQTVWEWRHGLRKPRGRRILKALEGIKVVNGRWCKQS